MNLNCLITSNQHTLSGVYSTQWGDFKVLAWLEKSICSDFAFLCKFCNWLACIYLVSLHAAVLLSDSGFKARNQTRQSLKQRKLKGYFMDLTLLGTKEANLAIYIPAARHCWKFTMAQVSTPYQESNTCDRLSTHPPACWSYFLLTTLQLKKIVLSSQTKTSPYCK